MRRLFTGITMLLALAAGCATLATSAAFDRALDAFERGDYREATARAEEAIARGQDSARLRTLLGWSLYRTGDSARAKTEFERALKIDPRDANAYFAHEGLGWIAYKAADYGGAIKAFNESLRLVPGYHNAHSGLGWAYLGKREFTRAEDNFTAALTRAPGDADARRGLGFVAYHRADWPRAIERFRDIVKDNDADNLTWSALGWAHYEKGETALAQKIFVDVARREPSWADPLLGQAWIAERQHQAADAKALFRAAIDRSAIYVAAGETGESVRKLFAARADWRDLWRDLAWKLYDERAHAEAEAEFRQIIERDPKNADAQRGLGFALYARKRYREAIPPLERSLGLNADLPPVRERVEIPGAPGLHPIVSDAASTLAWAHYQLADYPRALGLFREVTAKRPESADAWAGLGWSLVKTGEAVGAESAFRRSLSVQPNYPDAVAGLRALGKVKS
jgi:protein O-GlcNAc transferase